MDQETKRDWVEYGVGCLLLFISMLVAWALILGLGYAIMRELFG